MVGIVQNILYIIGDFWHKRKIDYLNSWLFQQIYPCKLQLSFVFQGHISYNKIPVKAELKS